MSVQGSVIALKSTSLSNNWFGRCAECALYDHPVLSRFLPQRHETITPQQAKAAAARCENEAAAAAMQWPCLVLEQGEDLQSICSREDSVLGALHIRQVLRPVLPSLCCIPAWSILADKPKRHYLVDYHRTVAMSLFYLLYPRSLL